MARWVSLKEVREKLGYSGGHLSYILKREGVLPRKDHGSSNKYINLDCWSDFPEVLLELNVHCTRELSDAIDLCQHNIPLQTLKKKLGKTYSFKIEDTCYLWKEEFEALEDVYDIALGFTEELDESTVELKRLYRKNRPVDYLLLRELSGRLLLTEKEIVTMVQDLGSAVEKVTIYGTYYDKHLVKQWVSNNIDLERYVVLHTPCTEEEIYTELNELDTVENTLTTSDFHGII